MSWVADDDNGRALRAELRDAGVDVAGVAIAGTRTAESFIAYDPGGRSLCFYDPGDGRPRGLGAEQRDAIAAAAVVCLTVAPREATRDALACLRPDARVVWSVKADADAYPPELVAALLDTRRRGRAGPGRARVPGAPGAGPRTGAGRAGDRDARHRRRALVLARPSSAVAAVEPVRTADTTGAGDAFVAGAVAHLTRRPEDAAGAVQAGVRASRALLAGRGEEEEAQT